MTTQGQWAAALLASIPALPTRENLISIVSVIEAEGTSCKWNPLDTCLGVPGSYPCNPPHCVQQFPTMIQGIAATRATLALPAYGKIILNLMASSPAGVTLGAWRDSPWLGYGQPYTLPLGVEPRIRADFTGAMNTPLKAAQGIEGFGGNGPVAIAVQKVKAKVKAAAPVAGFHIDPKYLPFIVGGAVVVGYLAYKERKGKVAA